MSVIDRLQQSRGRFLVVLGLPALALSLAVTTVSGLLPVIVAAQAGALVAGALVAIEGIFALTVPLVVGPLSDRSGRRLPFLAGAGAVAAAALVLIGLSGPLALIALSVAVFYVGYFAYLTPYYALFPDLVGATTRGRSQGSLGTWREVGLGVAFVAGPALLALWRPAPFVLAAAVILLITPVFGAVVARRQRASGSERPKMQAQPNRSAVRRLLAEHRAIRWFVAANALWELALAALRAFVVLFLTVGLSRPESFASLVLGVVVVAALVAAPLAGWLGDRFGQRRVLAATLWVYGIGLLLPAVSTSVYVLPLVFAGALAAVTVMTLPYALLMDLLPEGDHGSAAAVYGFSRGLGLLAGPLLAGLAIVILEPVFASTDGYAAIFPVASLAVLASIPLLRRCVATTARGANAAPESATSS